MLGEIRPGLRDLTTAPIAFGSSSENRVPIGGNGCDNWCSRILFNLCQVIVVLAFAPLTSGVLSRLKEMVQSKTGPSIFQPYWDLWKLFHKDEIVSEESSWIFRFTPCIVFVTPIFVALLIPVLTSYPLFFAFMGDMLGGGFVLSLGGFFAALAAVDTAILTVPWARAALCLAFGVLPTYIIPVMGMALAPFVGDNAADALVPPFFASNPARHALPPAFVAEFHDLGAQVGQSVLPGRGLVVLHRGGYENPIVFAMSTSYMLVALIVLLVLTYLIVRLWLTRRRLLARRPRWDGGVRRLWPEMTYTATGFSNPVRVIFDAVFKPTTVADTRETVAAHFRIAIRREKGRVHLVERLVFKPTRRAAFWCAALLAAMHHGRFNAYAAYALLSLLIVLVVFLLFQTS